MKHILQWVILFHITGISFSQTWIDNPSLSDDKAKYESIVDNIRQKDFLNAVIELNSFIPRYPNAGVLYYMRAGAKMGLGDRNAAKKDFELAKWAGFTQEETFVNAMISKKYLIQKLLKDLDYDIKLDSARGFKPAAGLRDSLQGGLRPERTCYDVSFYDLTVKVNPDSRSIEGQNKIYFTTTENTERIQLDLFPEYTIKSVKSGEQNLDFERNYAAIFIELGKVIPPGSKEEILIEYGGIPREAPRPPWNGGFVWEKVKKRHHVGVACEHLGASSWWPCKDHLSDKPDSMRINLLVPSGYIGLSNGNLRSETNGGDGYTKFEWIVSYPINSYNVTFYMGDFINFNEKFTNSDKTYQIDYYVLPQNVEKARKYYSQTAEILTIFESLFGEYPFTRDGVGMVEAPFEGMEHQGAIAIGGGYGKSSNKREYWTKDYDYLLIHETAHEWWGNALAIGDMADAWINEGFGTYSEYLFAEEKFGYPEYIKALASNNVSILNIWPLVGDMNINENTFLGGDIYNKGAAMLNNLRCILDNDTLFRRIIRDFFERYKFKISTTVDFISIAEEETGKDLSDFFKKFLYETDPPVLECSYKLQNGTLSFNYRWINTGKNFTMPFCIAINDKEYIRLNGTSYLQTFKYDKVKTFHLPNEMRYDKDMIPGNCFTYYWTSWSL